MSVSSSEASVVVHSRPGSYYLGDEKIALVPRITWISLAITLVLVALPVRAEIYKWVDENGTVHFSQDRNTLGGNHGPGERDIDPDDIEVMPFDFGKGADKASVRGDVYKIKMSRSAGGSYVVRVRLNDKLSVLMMLDTGSSDIVIPQSVARKLGYTSDDAIAMRTYETANGRVQHPVVRLSSVAVNAAKVLGMEASISPSMPFGLLGTSFLGRFSYTIQGDTLTLRKR